MKHARSGKKLGRDAAHRRALYSNLAGSLIEHGRIQTTEAKAKAVKPFAEKMITLGKRGDLAARRQALAQLRSQFVVAPPLRRGRAALRGASRRLHAHHQARPAPGRRRRDGVPGARGLRASGSRVRRRLTHRTCGSKASSSPASRATIMPRSRISSSAHSVCRRPRRTASAASRSRTARCSLSCRGTGCPRPSDTNLGFLVDDVAAATVELAALGIEPDGPLLTGGGYRYRHFAASDGRRFELLDRQG